MITSPPIKNIISRFENSFDSKNWCGLNGVLSTQIISLGYDFCAY